jgi:pimeloyl-ACP methyl ester carboxylesterase
LLAARGRRVIRFDNRDVGLSTKLSGKKGATMNEALAAVAQGEPVNAVYRLHDMADDTAALLDGLSIKEAHVVGMSMGGMIAQHLAIQHPTRVKTLTAVMTTSGAPGLPGPTAAAMGVLFSPRPVDRERAIEATVAAEQVLAGPAYPVDMARATALATEAYDRCFYPAGFVRQFIAVLASGSRRELLRSVTAPTLVLHGDADPLIPVACGIDVAEHVPGAKLHVIEGWGHTLPPSIWPALVDQISAHTA